MDFALVRLTNILDNMIVYPQKMLKNLNLTKGLIFSQELMLELTKSGLSREKSYKMVQNYAKKCFAEDIDLISIVMKDKFIMSKISPKKLRSIFSYSKHFIVSPSSFHWWGAWLNQNNDKICLRPSKINPSNNPNFWPNNWISV